MNKFTSIVTAGILAITIIILLIMTLPRIDRFLDIRAVEACSNSSSFIKENTDENFTAKYPIEDLYKNCISSLK